MNTRTIGRALLSALLVLASLGCNRAYFRNAGDDAAERGNLEQALSNWVAARGEEGNILSRREMLALREKIDAAVDRLSQPAMQAASAALRNGDGERALDILLPLYAGKGLWRHYSEDGIETARSRVVGDIREALSLAAGIDLQALTGDGTAIDAAGERISALRKRLEIVPARVRGPLDDALADLAGPTLERGWDVVRELLGAERTLEAMTLAERLAKVLPNVRSHAARRDSTRSHARQIHDRRATKVCPGQPGLCWAERELAKRFGGSGGASIRAELRRVQYRVAGIQACNELQSALRSALQRGSGGVPVDVEVRFGPCATRQDRWETRRRVSWVEERVREVPTVERYTAYESKQQCSQQRVYANTTCTTSYVGNGFSRRTCRDNYNYMQRCRTVAVPVTRTRTVMRRVVDHIRHTITRVISHQRNGFATNGTISVRWPGGETSLAFQFSDQSEDSAYSDAAGRDPMTARSVSAMRSAAVDQARAMVHRLDEAALRPKAQAARATADAAIGAGDEARAADFALQAMLLGVSLHSSDPARFARLLKLPDEVAGHPGRWGTAGAVRLLARQGAKADATPRKSAQKPRRDPLAGLFGGGGVGDSDDGRPVASLIDPPLPPTDRDIRRRYAALSQTSYGRDRDRDRDRLELTLQSGNGIVRPSLIGLSVGAAATYGKAARIEAGGEVDPLGLGLRGLHFSAMVGTWRTDDDHTSGFGVRYQRQDAPGVPGHSALDLTVRGSVGERFGFWYDLGLNLADWIGDDALKHYHRVELGLFFDFGIGRLQAGGAWWIGGGVRWSTAISFRF